MNKNNEMTLKGVLPVIPTPFNEDGGVDKEAIKKITSFCIESGAGGLVFPGVASEYDFLSAEERLELLEVIYEVNKGKLPLICGGGKGDAETIVNNILESEPFGFHAAMILIPKQYANDEKGAHDFLATIAKRVPNLSIILQNAPLPVGAGLSPKAICRIAESIEQVKYIKEETLPSGSRITELIENAPDHLIGVIGGGGARYIIDEMKRSVVATMPASEITDLHVQMWNAFKAGDVETAREIYKDSLPLLIIQAIYRMRLTKHVLTERGIFKNDIVRAPLPEFDDYDKKELSFQLQSLSKYFKTTVLS
ncbi:dihydrodipicolinate synthase family protein [Flavivirga algicola]|uniref:Dihydrodipicolinate synthase family protein n=1 Tax=Flavivirga algicola TaxID=2729136 RepID=A0ABX1RWM7_9FLAO|nr:dihydrodipicolinate synthase family protein [Flavivirga algicola]NMH86827.1 dihydrodipicolinate synthase family protein [Flavivirga algicola]